MTQSKSSALLSEAVKGTDPKAATKKRRESWKIDTDYPATDIDGGGTARIVRSVKTGRPMGEIETAPGTFANVEVPAFLALAKSAQGK
jgi:hypothetical protein